MSSTAAASASSAAAEAPIRRLSAFEELVRANNPSRCYRRSEVFLSSRHSDTDPTSASSPSESFGGGGSPLRMPDPRPSAQSTFIPPPSVLPPQVISSMIDASGSRLTTTTSKKGAATSTAAGQKRPRGGAGEEDNIHSSFLLVKEDDEEDSPPLIEASAVLPTTLLEALLSCDNIINSRSATSTQSPSTTTNTTSGGGSLFTRVELPLQLTQDDFDEAEDTLLAEINGGGGEWSLVDVCMGRADGVRRGGIRIEKRIRLVTLRDEAPVAVSIPSEQRGGGSSNNNNNGGGGATDAGFIPPTTLMTMVGTKVWCAGEGGGFRYGFGCYPFPTPNSDVATFFTPSQDSGEKSDIPTTSQHRVDIQSYLTFGRRDNAVPPYHKFAGDPSSNTPLLSSERIQKGNRLYCTALHDNRCARAVQKAIKECEAAAAATDNNQGSSSSSLPIFTVDIPVDHPSCSGQHVVLYWGLVRTPASGGLSVEECTWSLELHLQDLGSTHGVLLNGTKMPRTLTSTPSGRLPNGNGLQLYQQGVQGASITSWGSAGGDSSSNVAGLLPGDSFKLGTSSREYVVVEDEGPTGSWIQES